MAFALGETVGPYRIVERLGSGGMATVFKAYHPSLDRYIAIKVLHPAFKNDPQFFERFKREARIVANLEHPNIIPVYDFNEHNGEPYLVMRFIEGDTLKPNLQGQPTPPAEVLRLMRPVCQALAYAHKQGVLHRDIKPSNIMVTRDGNIFITDFGLARMTQTGASSLTQDMMVGTPQYISPEQARGTGKLDGRTDIYSLGVVLFEMFTGRVPFKADTPFATIHDHIYTPLPLPSSINPDIDPAIERLLLKTLAKEPDERFSSADELLSSLEATLAPQLASDTAPTIAAAPPASLKRAAAKKRRGPLWLWLRIAAVVFLCGLVLAGLASRTNQNKNRSNRDEPPAAQQQPVNADSPQQGDATQITRQANLARQRQNLERAIELYNQAIAADPSYMPAYFELADTLRESGEKDQIAAVLNQAVEHNPQDYMALSRLGETQLFIEEDPETALVTFENAVAQAPQTGLPYTGQALALLALNRVDEAKEALDIAIEIDGLTPETNLASAVYLARQGQKDAAIELFEQLIKNQRASPLLRERAQMLMNRLIPQ